MQACAVLMLAVPPPRILTDYPTVGQNHQAAGGGGKCSYMYAEHDGAPVVRTAKCVISHDDLDKGTEPDQPARDYVRNLGGHDHCNNDDAGHILANRA